MIWTILDIEETKNKKAIMRAYREKLTVTNPEEKPEEFKKLRAAYEEALRLADMEEPEAQDELPEEEKTPLQRWTDMLSDVYFDLKKRLDVEAWKQLLDQDFSMALDTRIEAEDAMLQFFMEHYRVPHRVWLLLEEHFHFLDHEESLYEKFPGDFIRYVVMSGIDHDDYVPLDLMEGVSDGALCDEYISLYYKISKTPFEQCVEEIAHMESMPVSHPYAQALIARYHIRNGEMEALEQLKTLYEKYPKETTVLLELMWAHQDVKNSQDAITCADKLLELEKDHRQAMYVKALANADMGNYQQAVEVLNQMMDLAAGNQKEIYQLAQLRNDYNNHLIEDYEKAFAQDKEDAKMIFDLTWAYFQNDQNEKAIAMLPYLKPGYPNDFRYYYTCTLLQIIQENLEEAVRLADQIAVLDLEGEAYENSPKKRNERVANTYIQIANIQKKKDDRAGAASSVEKALAIAPDDSAIATYAAEMFLFLKMYSRALDCGLFVANENPDSYHGHYLVARILFEMHRDQEAFQALNRALDLDQSDLWVHLLKLRILVRNKAYEGAENLIQYLEEEGIKDHIVLEWMKAEILRNRDSDYEGAYAIYEKLHQQIDAMEEKWDITADFYYFMAQCLADKNDAKKNYDRKVLIKVLDLGLAADPDHEDCQEYKAWLLRKDDRIDESIAIYKRIEEIFPDRIFYKKQLAETYYEDTYNYARESLSYHEMIEDHVEESAEFHQNMSYLYYLLEDYDKAIAHTQRAHEMEPDSEWHYYRFSIIYAAQQRLPEALEYAKLAVKAQLERVQLRERRRTFYWTHLANILRRMGRWADAITAYNQCKAHTTEFKSYYKRCYETYVQEGLWKEAKKILDEWKKADKEHPEEWAGDVVLYHLFRGEKLKAAWTMDAHRMDPDDRAMGQSLLAAEKGNFTPWEEMRAKRLDKSIKKKKKNLTYEYAGYAFALWMSGKYEEAKKAAEEGLRHAEIYETKNDESAPVTTGSAAVCLAILGRIDEAREAAGRMNHQPLCFSCSYRCCKDYFVYLAKIELIAGNREKMKELLETLKEYDHYEETCLILEAYTKKKKGKAKL